MGAAGWTMLIGNRLSWKVFVAAVSLVAPVADQPATADERGVRVFTARASEIDSRTGEHPQIDFVFEKDGKPQDVQHAAVNLEAPLRGQLVIWLITSRSLSGWPVMATTPFSHTMPGSGFRL
jgi:hypothetical protein